MLCWSARKRLSAHIDGELPAEKKARLEEHLAHCPACAARERELRRAWDGVADLPDPPPAADLWPGVLDRLRPSRPGGESPLLPLPSSPLAHATVAVCAVVGLVAGSLFALRFTRPPPPRAAAAARPSADDPFAEAFGDLALESGSASPGERVAAPAGTPGAAVPQEDAR